MSTCPIPVYRLLVESVTHIGSGFVCFDRILAGCKVYDLGIIKIFPSMRFWEDIDHKPYFFIFYIGFVVLVSGLSAEATRWVVFCNQK